MFFVVENYYLKVLFTKKNKRTTKIPARRETEKALDIYGNPLLIDNIVI